jgi:hypothetical protein
MQTKKRKHNHKPYRSFIITLLLILLASTGSILYFGRGVPDSDSSIDPDANNSDSDSSINTAGDSYTSDDNTSKERDTSMTENLTSDTTDQTSALTTNTDVNNEEPISPDRVTLRDGFYYEPLPDRIRDKITGSSYHENDDISYDDLRYLTVRYIDFDGDTQTGELICNKAIAQDLLEIFAALYDDSYQIEKIRLVDEYNADDDLSCADNNTSCFNYRVVAGTDRLSNHALGLAIDINPFYNPYITYPDGKEHISPEGSEPYADRESGLAHMILENDLCYQLFKEHGFTWGGNWKSVKDYQHFEKSL